MCVMPVLCKFPHKLIIYLRRNFNETCRLNSGMNSENGHEGTVSLCSKCYVKADESWINSIIVIKIHYIPVNAYHSQVGLAARMCQVNACN